MGKFSNFLKGTAGLIKGSELVVSCELPKFRKRKLALIPVLYAQANHGLTREASASTLAILQGYKINLGPEPEAEGHTRCNT